VLLTAVLSRFRGIRQDRLAALMVGLLLYTVARFVVFPASYIRFNAPVLVGLVILLVCAGGLAQASLHAALARTGRGSQSNHAPWRTFSSPDSWT